MDVEPPLFSTRRAEAVAVELAACGAKNPIRPCHPQFMEPVLMAIDPSGEMGHWNAETRAFWPAAERMPRAGTPAKMDVLGVPPEATRIPASALASRASAGSSFECFDFAHRRRTPAVLFVRGSVKLVKDAMGSSLGAWGTVKSGGAFAVSGWGPAEHLGVLRPDEDSVVDLKSEGFSGPVAHRLCAAGLSVSVPVSAGEPHPVLRVQSSLLRWVKDVDLLSSLSGSADSVPGMSACQQQDDRAGGCAIWSNLLYDGDMGVPRAMMSWGAFAAWTARQHLVSRGTAPNLDKLCEPLASYTRALTSVQAFRNGTKATLPSPQHMLPCNTAARMSSAQIAHASDLFYWCAVHSDPESLPQPRETLRNALEMYLRFGHVVLTKRAYHFHAEAKRKREEDQ